MTLVAVYILIAVNGFRPNVDLVYTVLNPSQMSNMMPPYTHPRGGASLDSRHGACLIPRFPCSCPLQFVPEFTRLARRRIKELRTELRDMPKELTDENQRWDAFRMVLSRVRDQLRDMLTIGDCGTVCGEGVNIVPHVTDIYREYANDILEVR